MKIILVYSFLLLAACAARPETIREDLGKQAAALGFKEHIYQTGYFKIFTLQKITNPDLPLRIYIEGDGRAYLNKSMPSSDPTPQSRTLPELVEEDNYPNIVYLARPCQYGLHDDKCGETFWTLGRFAPEVVNSENEVVHKFGNNKIELVGYSGGAEIAVFLAAANPNIISLRTIAGNLDYNAFTKIHDSAPLIYSVNPDNAIKKISNLPQVHFIGAEDTNITAEVAQSYKAKQNLNSCSKFMLIDGATHSEGWQEKWPELLAIVPTCIRSTAE